MYQGYHPWPSNAPQQHPAATSVYDRAPLNRNSVSAPVITTQQPPLLDHRRNSTVPATQQAPPQQPQPEGTCYPQPPTSLTTGQGMAAQRKPSGSIGKYANKAKNLAKPAALIAGAATVEAVGLSQGVDLLGSMATLGKAYNSHKAQQAQRLSIQNGMPVLGTQSSIPTPPGSVSIVQSPLQNSNSQVSYPIQSPGAPQNQYDIGSQTISNSATSEQPAQLKLPSHQAYSPQCSISPSSRPLVSTLYEGLAPPALSSHPATTPSTINSGTPQAIPVPSRKPLTANPSNRLSVHKTSSSQPLPTLGYGARHVGHNLTPPVLKYPEEIPQQQQHQQQPNGSTIARILKEFLQGHHVKFSQSAPTQNQQQSPPHAQNPAPQTFIAQNYAPQLQPTTYSSDQYIVQPSPSGADALAASLSDVNLGEEPQGLSSPISTATTFASDSSGPQSTSTTATTNSASSHQETAAQDNDVLVDLSSLGGIGYGGYDDNTSYFTQATTVVTDAQPPVDTQSVGGVIYGPPDNNGTSMVTTTTTMSGNDIVYDTQSYSANSVGYSGDFQNTQTVISTNIDPSGGSTLDSGGYTSTVLDSTVNTAQNSFTSSTLNSNIVDAQYQVVSDIDPYCIAPSADTPLSNTYSGILDQGTDISTSEVAASCVPTDTTRTSQSATTSILNFFGMGVNANAGVDASGSDDTSSLLGLTMGGQSFDDPTMAVVGLDVVQ
ncbi:MAG: hypothetical protein M1820_004105 [Bogoriella megaspora]|nr:MAG: hypothetical protein M1820_004105 [Bogoriella megaspora]